VEVGCLGHPGALTDGIQLLDVDCSHGWQFLATQPHSPRTQRETGTRHTDKTVQKGTGRTEAFLALKTYWQMLGFAYAARTSNIP